MTNFALTWDYRCPFARNAHEHVITALREGAEWDVRFVPFSLAQVHVTEGQTDVWERPEDDSGLAALEVAVVVRDNHPDRFLDVHHALFALRHDQGRHLSDPDELRAVLKAADIDPDPIFAEIAGGQPLATVRDEHTDAATTHDVWGVPTFIVGDAAAFVRLMERPNGTPETSRHTIERVLSLLTDAPELNEFKYTTLTR